MGKSEPSDPEIAAAEERGRARAQSEPRATGVRYDAETGRVVVELRNGCVFGFPAELAQGLRGASAEELAEVRVMPGGRALQWDRLDAGFTVPGLLGGIFGTQRWMEEVAAEMGRKGGSATTEAKAAASRANGLKGGRPRKHLRSGEASQYQRVSSTSAHARSAAARVKEEASEVYEAPENAPEKTKARSGKQARKGRGG